MAKLAGSKTISKDEMKQQINLKRYLGRDATESEAKLFAELAVDKINNRTLDGDKVGGGTFTPYSPEYAAKKGVSESSVDLFLEGDMLDSLDTKTSKNLVTIELQGDLQTKKGYNHHVGDTLPKRPWFGLTREEAREIADSVKSATPEQVEQETQPQQLTLSQLKDLLGQLGIEQVE